MQKYAELLRTILEKRGITDPETADLFLNPDYEKGLHDPFLMRDMEKSCVRLYSAIDSKEKIVIYADYDCDGIPGAIILEDLLKKVGYTNYEIYIPKRNSEGYGLNMAAIEEFIASGVKLLVTVDLGITAVEEVTQAQASGIDVIVTDHHLPPQVLPRAFAILNPKTDNYPEKMLCGAGVAFKFAQGFIKKYGEAFNIPRGAEKWMLDMAGLATLSDMVPLQGENRTLAHFGLMVLRKSRRKGLQRLLEKMNIDQRYLSEDDIGFMLAPRLNAASRMDDPRRAYELLSVEGSAEAETLANHLSKINDERKAIVTTIMREANKKLKEREEKEVIVIGNPEWRVGVLGLVAGRLADEHKKPVFVWGKDENGLIKGSCRGGGVASVVELMTAAKNAFIEFGGHEQAGGFTVESEQIHFLEDLLSQAYQNMNRESHATLQNPADIVGDFGLCTMSNWRELERLAPFGLENPKPVFLFENIKVNTVRTFGKNGSGEHLEIIFSDDGARTAKAVSFFSNMDSFGGSLASGTAMNLLATFDLSRFRGREELRLRIVDILKP